MRSNVKWIFSILCLLFCMSDVLAQRLIPVEWERITGYCESGGQQTKCSVQGWNAGSVSKDALKASEDGEIEIVVKEIASYKMMGLGINSTTNHFRDIDYALYQTKNRLYIYESGVNRLRGPYLAVGDVIEIRKINNTIQYYHNNKLVYTSGRIASMDLYVSGSSYSVGSILQDVISSFATLPSTLKDVTWARETGFCDSGSNRIKCVSSSWGNAGFVSNDYLPKSDDGEMEYIVKESAKYNMIGLGKNSTSNHYRDINYAVYQNSNRLYIYENGSRKVTGPSIAVGDKIVIKKISNIIHYFQNDQLLYKSLTPVNLDLYVSASAYTPGTYQQNVKASFVKEISVFPPSVYVTEQRNSRVIVLKNYLSFAYTEKYYKQQNKSLVYKIYDVTNSQAVTLNLVADLKVKRGLNEYQYALSDFISPSQLISSHRYRIEILENPKKMRFFDFVYKP